MDVGLLKKVIEPSPSDNQVVMCAVARFSYKLGGYAVEKVRHNGEHGSGTLLVRMTRLGAPAVMLKIFEAPLPEGRLDRIIGDQNRARQVFRDKASDFDVPAILCHDVSIQAFAMTYVQASPLSAQIAELDDLDALFERFGAKMAELGQNTALAECCVRDLRTINETLSLIDRVYNGRLAVAFPRRFLDLADGFKAALTQAGSLTIPMSMSHGDLNSHNVLIDGPSVHLIDFHGLGPGTLLDDLIHLVAHSTMMATSAGMDPEDWGSWMPSALDGYFTGLGQESPPPVLRLLVLQRLLRMWLFLTRTGVDLKQQMRPRFRVLMAWADQTLASH